MLLPAESRMLEVGWTIRTPVLTYWLDCNGPFLCQIEPVHNTSGSFPFYNLLPRAYILSRQTVLDARHLLVKHTVGTSLVCAQ